MRLVPRLTSLWSSLFHKDTLDRDLDEEIRATVETLADRYVAAGLSPRAAERAALAALGGPGGILQVKEEVREVRIGAGLESILFDLRYAWRSLWNAPRLTIVLVLTLALGIGANTAIFSVVNAMLLAPLPYRDADRLVFVWLDQTDIGYPRGPLSGPDLQNLREGSRSCTDFGAIWATGTVALTGEGPPEQLRSALVTANFFEVLGAESAIGRTFRADDSAPGAHPTILLGWDLFARRFGGDPSIVGRQILVNDQPTTVIGVMPRSFRLLLPQDSSVPDRLQVWQPFWHDLEREPRGHLFLRVVGRMRPGVTVDQARADLDSIAGRITRELGDGPRIHDGHAAGRRRPGGARTAAGAVRGRGDPADDRVRERGEPCSSRGRHRGAGKRRCGSRSAPAARGSCVSRSSKGSCSRRSARRQARSQATLGLRVLVGLAPDSLSRIQASRIDVTVFGFTLAIAVVWGVLLSLAPTIGLFTTGGGHALRSAGRSAAPPFPYRARATLVVVQIALSVVLLIGAGLLARAFVAVQRVDTGFSTDRHLTFRVALPESRYPDANAVVTAALTSCSAAWRRFPV